MNKWKWIGLSLLLVLAACGQAGSSQTSNTDSQEKQLQVDASKIDQAVLKGNQQFAFELFHELTKEEENVFISPYSISTVLSMVLAGAETDTETEMKNVMHYEGIDDQTMLDTYHNYSAYLQNAGEKVDIDIGNSVWLDEGFLVKENYEKMMTDQMRSEVFEKDLQSATVVDDMNKWVSAKTNGMIKELRTKPYPANTRLLLTNAIYFNGKWEHPFKDEFTEEGDFHLSDGSTQQQKMMHQTEELTYTDGEGYDAVRLPYGEKGYSMYAVLPEEEKIDTFVQSFGADDFLSMKQRQELAMVTLTFPSFKTEFGVKSLNKSLRNLGMERIFGNADLTGMSDASLFVNNVIHKAVIDVTEEGTEAAAVTQASVAESAEVELPKKVFKGDRPFFYIIADDKNDTILFMGTYEGERE